MKNKKGAIGIGTILWGAAALAGAIGYLWRGFFPPESSIPIWVWVVGGAIFLAILLSGRRR